MTETWLLLADGNPFEAVSRYLNRTGSSRETLLLVLFAILIGTIWTTLLLLERLRRALPERAAKPELSLFESLCQAHQLTAQDIALLTSAAGERLLANPSFLFVQPDHWQALSVEPHPDAQAYRQLRERLFGSMAT